VDLFYERGYHATGMDEIGETAGVTGPAIYRHFTSKEDLLASAVDRAITQIMARVHDIVEHADGPEETLRELVHNFIRAALNKPALVSLVMSERRVLPPAVVATFDRASREHIDSFVQALTAARPKWTAGEVDLAVGAVFALLTAAVRAPSSIARARLEELLQTMAEAVLFGPNRNRPLPLASRPAPEPVEGAPKSGAKGRKPRRRDVILSVAVELFAERGFAATGIDEIGAAAGITGPGVYRHFTSKDEILKVVIQDGLERLLTERAPAPLELDEPADVTLRRLVAQLVTDAGDNSMLGVVAWNELRHLSSHNRAWITRLTRLRFAEWVHVLSHLRTDCTDPELLMLVEATYGMVIGVYQQDIALDEELLRGELAAIVLRALLTGQG
jgi:AcrR family transcriptional regulator